MAHEIAIVGMLAPVPLLNRLDSGDWSNIRWIAALVCLMMLVNSNQLDTTVVLAFLGGAALPIGNLLGLPKEEVPKP